MRRGKLTEKELNMALASFTMTRSEVIKGAALGEDCAVIECGGRILLTTDPITGVCDNIEELSLAVNMNDIFAGGGEPLCALVTLLAPQHESVDNVINTIARLGKLASQKGIDIVGGHTEFTDAVNRIVISVTMLGRQAAELTDDIKVGDDILVTKFIGLEATKIKITPDNYTINGVSDEEFAQLESQDLSIEVESKIARSLIGTKSMHDITEGGVYGAAIEMMAAKNLGVEIYPHALPILPATVVMAKKFGYDIGYTISSGSMIIITDNGLQLRAKLIASGINATIIGKVTAGGFITKDEYGRTVNIEMRCDELFAVREGN